MLLVRASSRMSHNWPSSRKPRSTMICPILRLPVSAAQLFSFLSGFFSVFFSDTLGSPAFGATGLASPGFAVSFTVGLPLCCTGAGFFRFGSFGFWGVMAYSREDVGLLILEHFDDYLRPRRGRSSSSS